MSYLLDTSVVSALRVPHRNPAVAAWVRTIPLADLYVAATTIAEIERGVATKERTDHAQGSVLRRWFDEQVLPAFADRVVPFDLAAARTLSTYRVPDHVPLDDAMIGAVADSRGYVVATRNIRHFRPLGIPTINPWDVPQPD